MEGGRMSGMASRQDEGSFEDALRRLNALELKLTEQVKIDIHDLKQTWLQPKVDRVTRNAFKLFQVREQLKLTKTLFVEEERILDEFNKVKELLRTNSMDEEEFDATKETCVFLGAKLAEIRRKQANCYSDNKDMEVVINKEIMKLKFEDKDYDQLDLEQVRASTPVRQMSPTPLERHRSRSRDPSPFRFPPFKLGTGTITPGGTFKSGGGTITPGGTIHQDPHAYFSRPGSSQSIYGGRGGIDPDLDAFRQAMEAKQREDDSPPAERKGTLPHGGDGYLLRSSSGQVLAKSESSGFLAPGSYFLNERPASALSEMSINVQDGGEMSRPGSRLEAMGDVVSSNLNLRGGQDFLDGKKFCGKYDPDEVDPELQQEMDIDFAAEERKKEEELELRVEREQERIKLEAAKLFEGKEKKRKEEEQEQKRQEEAKAMEKKRIEEEEAKKEKERLKKEEDERFKEREEKRKLEKEKEEAEEKRKKEAEAKKKEEERLKKIEEKKEKQRKEEEAAKKKQEEETKKAEEKAKKLEEKKKKMAEVKAKKEAEEQAKKESEEKAKQEKAKKEAEIKSKKEAEEKNKKEVEENSKQAELKAQKDKEAMKQSMDDKNSKDEAKQVESLMKEKQSLQKNISDLEGELTFESSLQSGETAEMKLASDKAGVVDDKNTDKQKPKSRDSSKQRKDTDQAKETAARSDSRGRPEQKKGSQGDPKNEKGSEDEKKRLLSKDRKESSQKTDSKSESDKKGAPEIRSLSRDAKDSNKAVSIEETKLGKDADRKRSLSRGKKEPEGSQNVDSKAPDITVKDSKEINNSVKTNDAQSKESFENKQSTSKLTEKVETAPEKTSRSLSRDRKSTLATKQQVGNEDQGTGKQSQDDVSKKDFTSISKDSVEPPSISDASQRPGSKSGSRQTSRTGSPVSILKKGSSRDASRDRSAATTDLELEEAKPLSRTGSLKKSGSFSKRTLFAEKKKISFDNDVEVEQFNTEAEPLAAAKEIFAAIANTSLASGMSGRKQKSRDSSTDRHGQKSSADFSPAEPAEYYPTEGSEFDNEDELMIIIGHEDERGEDEEPELTALHSRSQSGERARSRSQGERRGSAGSHQKSNVRRMSDEKYPVSLTKSRSGSAVPELESIMEAEKRISTRRDSSSDGGEKLSRPGSTGYTHLDEFERKLAQMETELEGSDQGKTNNAALDRFNQDVLRADVQTMDEMPLGEQVGSLTRGTNLWDLSPTLARASEDVEDFGKVAAEFKANVKAEELYAKVIPKSQRMSVQGTVDGHLINVENELGNVDHSLLTAGELADDDEESEYVFDEATGQRVSRTKKVSFAEEDERYLIERQGEVKGLGLSKLFSFGPPKPMKSLPGKEKKSDGLTNLEIPPAPPVRTSPRRSTSKEPSPAFPPDTTTPKAFISAMTGGLIGGKSPDTSRKEGMGSVFGSLLRKGRKGSKSGSRTSSADRSSLDYGSEDNDDGSVLRTSSRGSYCDDDDARSDSSFAKRLGRKLKRKPQKVQAVDFDELFARGMALSAQMESENNKDPFQQNPNLNIQEMSSDMFAKDLGNDRYDENGARFTPFEIYSHDEAFRRTQKEEGIGYAEKVKSYLDDQANSPRASIALNELGTDVGAEKERGRKRHRRHKESGKQEDMTDSKSTSLDKRKLSREYAKPEDIKLSPTIKRDIFTGVEIPATPDLQFLRKATEFVASNEVDADLSQPVWPAIAPPDKLPPTKKEPVENALKALSRLSPMPQHSTTTAAAGAGSSTADSLGLATTSEPLTTCSNMKMAGTSEAQSEIPSGNADPTAQAQVKPVGQFSPPKSHEPGDKGLPARLMPDKLMANEEFYEKLRSGLRNISIEADGTEDVNYQKYSHHLGRAEFGTLRKKEPSQSITVSRDPSGDRAQRQVALSRDTSGDRLSRAGVGMPGKLQGQGPSRRLSRQSSGTSIDHGSVLQKSESGASYYGGHHTQRSDSRMSDYSGALPDLEPQLFDEEDGPIIFSEGEQGPSVHRTQSLLVGGAKAPRPQVLDTTVDVIKKKEEVLRDIAQHKQQLREAKAWIQNGLMTAVGFCVVVYLQSLEMMTGQS